MRSTLTSLGIIIGVSAVIVMIGVGVGSQAEIESHIEGLGTNLLIVFPGSGQTGGVRHGAGSMNRFTLDDVEAIVEGAALLEAVSPVVSSGNQVIGGGENWFTSVLGVAPEYPSIRSWNLDSGSFFTDQEIRTRKKVAVLGKTVADELFPDQDPVGERIRIRSTPFEVIGVMEEKGRSAGGRDEDDVVLAPSTTVLYRLKGDRWIDMILASAADAAFLDAAEEEIAALLRTAHGIGEGEDDDFTVRTQAEITEAAAETSRVLTILLGSIAGVSLVVGGIGIMNIMLVSVTERTREIGIRISVGARGRDVLVQFLAESVALSLAGGVIGIGIAFAVSGLLERFADLPVLITPSSVLLAVVFSGAVGIFFGYYPARKAAALDPIDALRYE
ncbi:MAG: ABC transporter permease [Candidatus Eisenbacteria bacterium]|nr:ABC transporter permease [Candidatus Eisenbacteria bacterium]